MSSRDPWIRAAALRALAANDPRATSRWCCRGWTPTATSGCAWRSPRARPQRRRDERRDPARDAARRGPARRRGACSALSPRRAARTRSTPQRRHLEHPDLGVRVAAAEAVSGLSPAGLSEPLVAAWRRGLGDGEGELEARARRGGGARRPEGRRRPRGPRRGGAARPVPRGARPRGDAARRDRAARRSIPGPQLVSRAPLDYRAAMAPYDPRPGVPLYTPRAFLKTRHGTIEIHLDVVEAPLTTASFVSLARRGFYDGLSFHRVEPGFVVQGGCPRGDGNGGPGYALRCEITRRAYGRGAVGMALSGKDTGGSQFFITLSAAAAPRRGLHALRPGGGRHGRRRPDPAGRRDRAGHGVDGRVAPAGPPASGSSPSTSTARCCAATARSRRARARRSRGPARRACASCW